MPLQPGKRGRRPLSEKNAVQIADETYHAYQWKLKGYTTPQIAKELGVSVATVSRRLRRYIEEHVSPEAEEYRTICIDRQERLLRKLENGISNGDVRAIETASKIIDKIYNYNGLDTIKIDHSGVIVHMGSVAEELETLAAEIGLTQVTNSNNLAIDQSKVIDIESEESEESSED